MTHPHPLPDRQATASLAAAAVPARWAWHYRTLLHLQDRLNQAHTEHIAAAVHPRDKDGADRIDSAEELAERDVLWGELAIQDGLRIEVARALERIRDGTYGRCEKTGRAISEARLRATPWTRLCRAAAIELTPSRSTA